MMEEELPDGYPADARILLNALNDIASWPQGEKVTGCFDEPWSANRAREALSMWKSVQKRKAEFIEKPMSQEANARVSEIIRLSQ